AAVELAARHRSEPAAVHIGSGPTPLSLRTPDAQAPSLSRLEDLRLAGLDDPLGTALIDLDLALSGRRELFDDSFHFSHSGHPEVARILADGLEPLLRRRAEGGSR
ncbi:MAG: hypothetical protein AAFZ65_18290, partial [Planctomycetota bacterium]